MHPALDQGPEVNTATEDKQQEAATTALECGGLGQREGRGGGGDGPTDLGLDADHNTTTPKDCEPTKDPTASEHHPTTAGPTLQATGPEPEVWNDVTGQEETAPIPSLKGTQPGSVTTGSEGGTPEAAEMFTGTGSHVAKEGGPGDRSRGLTGPAVRKGPTKTTFGSTDARLRGMDPRGAAKVQAPQTASPGPPERGKRGPTRPGVRTLKTHSLNQQRLGLAHWLQTKGSERKLPDKGGGCEPGQQPKVAQRRRPSKAREEIGSREESKEQDPERESNLNVQPRDQPATKRQGVRVNQGSQGSFRKTQGPPNHLVSQFYTMNLSPNVPVPKDDFINREA